MELKDVPNDRGDFKDRGSLKKVVYATDETGHYEKVRSAGWEVENQATKQAWDEIEEEVEVLRKKMIAGELSPIPYFMNKKLMDIGILAKYMGKFQWQIKRHFNPGKFKQLSKKTLLKYCSVFQISLEELTRVNY